MKKILLLITAFICASTFVVHAQNFSIFHGTDSLYDGKTITVSDYDDVAESIIAFFNVKNLTNDNLTIFSDPSPVHMLVDTSSHSMCFGQCIVGFPFQSMQFAPQEEYEFDAIYVPGGVTGTSTVLYKFYSEVGNDTMKVTVNYSYNGTAVNNVKAAVTANLTAYPNPASNTLSFNYNINNTAKSSKIIIKNILGANMKEIELNNTSGKISNMTIDDLNPGIYFYSLQVGNETITTKKLIIKR